jgi:DNA replication protein DnaC
MRNRTPQTLPTAPELRGALKQLKLGPVLDVLEDRLLLAEQQKLSHADFLLLVLQDEISRRESSAAERRSRTAGLDPDMTFERWDTHAKVRFDARVLAELRSLRFLEQRKNALILGPVGVGKTFIANALGHLACRHRYRVHITRADDMLRRLRQSRFDNSRESLMAELVAIDLLIIDDFALEPMARDESRDIYQLFVERTGRAATIITSNRDTGEWIATFEDVLLAQSAVDRFINAAYDLVIEGESYRQNLKPRISTDDPPPEHPVTKPEQPIRRRRSRG